MANTQTKICYHLLLNTYLYRDDRSTFSYTTFDVTVFGAFSGNNILIREADVQRDIAT
jgi:hypothetical protein